MTNVKKVHRITPSFQSVKTILHLFCVLHPYSIELSRNLSLFYNSSSSVSKKLLTVFCKSVGLLRGNIVSFGDWIQFTAKLITCEYEVIIFYSFSSVVFVFSVLLRMTISPTWLKGIHY